MNLKVKYLGKIEVIFEMALGNESGNQVGSIHEKNRGKKSRETIPLNIHYGILVSSKLLQIAAFCVG